MADSHHRSQNMIVHSTNGVVDTTSGRRGDDDSNNDNDSNNNSGRSVNGAMSNAGIIVSAAPSSSILSSSSSSSTVHTLPDSVMIPFNASDLDVLRASLASNSLNNRITSNTSGINVCINTGNIVVNDDGATVGHLSLDRTDAVMNGISSTNMSGDMSVQGTSSGILNSNEITSDGMQHKRMNLITNNDHFIGTSSNNDNDERSIDGNNHSNRNAIGSSVVANGFNKTVRVNPSGNYTNNVISVDESGMISSNSFMSQHPIHANLGQRVELLDQDHVSFRNQQIDLMDGASSSSCSSSKSPFRNRSRLSSNSVNSTVIQQRVVNSGDISNDNNNHLVVESSGSSGVRGSGSGKIAEMATANIHHHASTSSSNQNSLSSCMAQTRSVSSSDTLSRKNNDKGEGRPGRSRDPAPSSASIWIQPNEARFPVVSSQSGLTFRDLQGSSSSTLDPQPGLVSISMGEDQRLHRVTQMATSHSFQAQQNQFPGLFQIPQVQRGESSATETFQAAAHSTFDQQAGPSSGAYRDLDGDSEATPSYSNMQHQMVSDSMAEPLNGAVSVGSSSLQSFNLVFDTETRKLSVQRVLSPSDSTVSQSTLTLEGSEATPNPALLPMVSQGYAMVQVNPIPSAFSQDGATGEVSTSSMGVVVDVEDGASSSGVGSLDGHLSSSQNIVVLQKLQDSSLDTGECDTTQEDIEFQSSQSPPPYPISAASNNIDQVSSLDSSTPDTSATLSHRVMSQQLARGHGSTSTGAVMEAAMNDSGGLRVVAMETGRPINNETRAGPSSSSSASTSSSILTSSSLSLSSSLVQQEPEPNDCHLQSQEVLPSIPEASASSSSCQTFQITQDFDETLPASSGLPMILPQYVRKSRRLELLELEPRASQRKKEGSYKNQDYDAAKLWCDECMLSYDTECPNHHLCPVMDRTVLSRAWASCPSLLQICRLTTPSGDLAVGVFAKRQIGKMTLFGPYIGSLVDSLEEVTSCAFPLMQEFEDGSKKYYDSHDENACNWMMFVRPANSFAEQNLVAFQYKESIFFSVTKAIESKQELKVWYAAHYAERLNLKPLELTEEDMQALDEEDAKFPCFECSRRFKSSAALQKHLETVHENEDLLDPGQSSCFRDFEDEENDADFRVSGSGIVGEDGGGGGRRRGGVHGKGRSRSNNHQWKKRSSNLYLNKTLKKYKRRVQSADKGLPSVRSSMYTRQGKDNGGNEWVCTSCGLTFDKRSLLNLHTLTHAAEDLVAGEIKMEDNHNAVGFPSGEIDEGDGIMPMGSVIACPKCSIVFTDHRELMKHVASHAQKHVVRNKPFDCPFCPKSFTSEDKLAKHCIVHGRDEDKPFECPVCQKRFVNNSAMACHMKKHSERKYYDCPVCSEDFDTALALKEHGQKLHVDENGNHPCPHCIKVFLDFHMLKRHVKAFHSTRVVECELCFKEFPRADKLRLHMLKHTTHREFMCELCGRQFKRKDKLKEHTKRMHSAARIGQEVPKDKTSKVIKKFVPKVMPTEYHRFIYKCHTCLLGFKRRGMLVNHLAKRHPDMKPEHVPELNLPILKTMKDFYCQYCDKIYKSSSKRKAHILKIHPGALVPPSARSKLPTVVTVAPTTTPVTCEEDVKNSSLLTGTNTTNTKQVIGLTTAFSHTVGSITTMPHGCKFCHKQYASKAKLLQHQRKKHSELVEPASTKKKGKSFRPDYLQIAVGDPSVGGLIQDRYETVPMVTVVAQPAGGDQLTGPTDLLTQAMTEIQQSYGNEFVTINPRLTSGNNGTNNNHATMVQIQSSPLAQTIDINQLSQALQSMTSSQTGVATVLAPSHASILTQQQQQQQVQLVTNSTNLAQSSQGIQLVTAGGLLTAGAGQGGQGGININTVGNQFITSRPWSTTFTTQFS